MSKDLIEDVQIIEPPIEELTKKNSGFKKACFSSCLTALLLLILGIVAFRLYLGRGPHEIKTLPKNYPLTIEVYDRYNVDRVTLISQKYKNRSLRLAGLFSKIIISPTLLNLSTPTPQEEAGLKKQAQELWTFINTPLGSYTDTVKIEWRNIESTTEAMMSFYKNTLAKNGFTITEKENAGYQIIEFNQEGVDGSLYVQKNIQNDMVSYAFLLINF